MKKFADASPALPAAVGAVLGVVAVEHPWLWLAAPLFLLLFILLKIKPVPVALFAVTAAATFFLALGAKPDKPDEAYFDGRERTWRGVVERVRASDRSQRCIVLLDSPAVMRCRMTMADLSPQLLPGDTIRAEATPESRLKYDGVPFLVFPSDPSERTVAEVVVMGHDCRTGGRADGLWYDLQRLSPALSQYIYDSPLAPATSRLLAASVLGGGDVGDERKAAFRASGLSHLLCVSGFHVAVFALVISILLFPLKIGERFGRWRYAVIIVAVWLYAIVTGLQPSVFRAAVMLTVYNMARLAQRNSPPFNSLCLAIVIILLASPLSLFSIGFQLSVAAVLGLLVFGEKFNPIQMGRRGHSLFALTAIPLAATVATAPVLLWHFHTLPLLSVPVNALVSLIFPLFMVAGCTVVLLSAAGVPMALPARGVDVLASATDRICTIATDTDGSVLEGIHLSAWSLAAMCIVLLLLAFMLHCERRRHRLIYAGAAVLTLTAAFFIPDRAAAADVVVHGNAFSSEIRVRADGHGYIIPLNSRLKPAGNPENYFADGLVSPDSIFFRPDSVCRGRFALRGNMLCLGNRHMLIADADTDSVRADILVLKARFRDHLDSLMSRTGATSVIIAADMNADRRERYLAAADSLGADVCDLSRAVFRAPF